MKNSSSEEKKMVLERRRTIRIRRSSLIKNQLDDLDRPSLKICDTLDEFKQAFTIVYNEYERVGYIQQKQPSKMYYGIHDFLPTTCVFVFKAYQNVISTLSQVQDSPLFGLPMDALYKKEIDVLRDQGRKVAEVCALASPKEGQWRNLIMFLGKAYFQYAKLIGINDILIMVNPKHVAFYKAIFLFEVFAEERFYPSVNAPAVALRINYDVFWERLRQTFHDQEFETDLYSFFNQIHDWGIDKYMTFPQARNVPLDIDAAHFFYSQQPEIFDGLNFDQLQYLKKLYPLELTSNCIQDTK